MLKVSKLKKHADMLTKVLHVEKFEKALCLLGVARH